MTYYALELLLARVAAGTTTERDADALRRFLLDLAATVPVAGGQPK